jgi:hypothetical protein
MTFRWRCIAILYLVEATVCLMVRYCPELATGVSCRKDARTRGHSDGERRKEWRWFLADVLMGS